MVKLLLHALASPVVDVDEAGRLRGRAGGMDPPGRRLRLQARDLEGQELIHLVPFRGPGEVGEAARLPIFQGVVIQTRQILPGGAAEKCGDLPRGPRLIGNRARVRDQRLRLDVGDQLPHPSVQDQTPPGGQGQDPPVNALRQLLEVRVLHPLDPGEPDGQHEEENHQEYEGTLHPPFERHVGGWSHDPVLILCAGG